MNIEVIRERIINTELLGPALKSQLVQELHNIDGERLTWIGILIDRAEEAHKKFGEKSAQYQRVISEIESNALAAAEREAESIFADFEKELAGFKF
jgi:hypothetical protein